MELLPFITMKKRKIIKNAFSTKEITDELNEINKVYILDLDGIEKDKPNLCTFQRLSVTHDLFVDSGPRDLGDVVDLILAGATEVTIRRGLCPQLVIESIREITENKIYANIEVGERISDSFMYAVDGFINLSRNKMEIDYNFEDTLKQYKNQKNTFVYEYDPANILYWEKHGINGLLVDIEKLEEFKKWMAKQKLLSPSSSKEAENNN
jgi:hypothetical protein